MFARPTALASLALRALIFAAVFVGPLGAFALSKPAAEPGIAGAGLVLFVSLQRNG